MTLYRIYTEYKNRGNIIEYVSSWFDGFTTYNGVGYWRGQAESCLIIEIITDYKHHDDILRIAEYIQRHNTQESVAITVQNVEVKTVGEQL